MKQSLHTIILVGIFGVFGISTFSFSENIYSFKNSDYFIEGGIRYGTALYHPQHDVYLKDLYFGSIETRFGLQTTGKAQWERTLNYPIIGVALRYTDYTDFSDPVNIRRATNDLLGKNIAIFGYLQGTIIKAKWFKWHYQIGMGIATFTSIYRKDKLWQPEGMSPSDFEVEGAPMTEWPDNDLISLYVNPYVNLQMGFDFKLTEQLDLCLNANFLHASNASMNMPNFGINELQGIVSLRYHFNKDIPDMHQEPIEKFRPTNALFFTIDPGWLWARYDDCYYFKQGISVGYSRQMFSILKVGAAFEAAIATFIAPSTDAIPMRERNASPPVDYNTSSEVSESAAFPPPPEAPEGNISVIRKGAAKISYTDMPRTLHTESIYGFTEVTFSRFALHIGVGGYIYKGPGNASKYDLAQGWHGESGTLKKNPYIYEKVGLRIYLGKKHRHFVGAAIRAHFPVADYLSFTYGYKFYEFSDIKKNR
ncbi:MAG: acyloxyacyl hydrolase [Bacteroidales bacterium]|nr:acyloxyacyl hydrolase [Bacteroidales bacterium]